MALCATAVQHPIAQPLAAGLGMAHRVQLRANSCGAAALAYLLSLYIDDSPGEAELLASADARYASRGKTIPSLGLSMADLGRLARPYDPFITALRFEGGLPPDNRLPMLLWWPLPDRPHFVVVTGRRGAAYRIFDPGYGELEMTPGELYRRAAGKDGGVRGLARHTPDG